MSLCSFFTLVFLISFCSITTCLSHGLNNGFSVELIHRDSSESPLYQPKLNKYQHITDAISRSINRVNHFYKVDSLTNTPKSTVITGSGEYLMTYSVGTPPFKTYGIVDTGSDIVWLQCEPCEECYNQTTPIFNPAKSSSYKNLPCSSDACQSRDQSSCSDKNNCQYEIQYGDQSHSRGDLSIETFTLDSTNGKSMSFPKTIIGCGHSNTGTFKGAGSGIVGLSLGSMSLINQLKFDKFSYCLVPLFGESNATSKLNFGDAAVVSGKGVVSTPLVQENSQIFYYLTLEAFSVGNKKINFRESLGGDDEDGNIIIDSGTTLTLLPQDVYSDLKSAVIETVKLKRVDDPEGYLDLCYSTTSNNYDFPIITAHFKGADVQLHPISTFLEIADGVTCFAFHAAPDSIGSIFGNLAQQNLLVGYDIGKQTISFKPTDCTKV